MFRLWSPICNFIISPQNPKTILTLCLSPYLSITLPVVTYCYSSKHTFFLFHTGIVDFGALAVLCKNFNARVRLQGMHAFESQFPRSKFFKKKNYTYSLINKELKKVTPDYLISQRIWFFATPSIISIQRTAHLLYRFLFAKQHTRLYGMWFLCGTHPHIYLNFSVLLLLLLPRYTLNGLIWWLNDTKRRFVDFLLLLLLTTCWCSRFLGARFNAPVWERLLYWSK